MRARSSVLATRASIGCLACPLRETSTFGFSRRLRNQAGWVSSPPRDATTTSVEPSRYGDVSITERAWPLFRPVVVSSSTGILLSSHPNRPPLTLSMPRWTAFIAFNPRSVGMADESNRWSSASPHLAHVEILPPGGDLVALQL